ncbi:MAG: CapA family protein [Candidatus Paceibacterota bacterium]|jgi:poly-gamma-glutamate synthesis protein (capsule biosynthesis protein)
MNKRLSKITISIIAFALGWSAMWVFSNWNTIVEGIKTKDNTKEQLAGNLSKEFQDINKQNIDSKKENYSADNVIKVMIGGDVMLDRGIRLLGNKYGYDSLFANIAPLFKRADIVAINLEGPITSTSSQTLLPDGKTTDSFTFTFAREVATTLSNAGITIVSLANNHSDNFGMNGIEETRENLDNVGIKYFGNPWNSTSNEEIMCKKEICIAFVGYNSFRSGFDRIVSRVKTLIEQDNFVIVMPHWGEEYSPSPTDKMKLEAKELVDAGAKVIVGSHSHIIGENEWLGDVPVYYSLGNLLFDQYFSPETMKGMVVELFIANNDGEPSLDHIETIYISNSSKRGITVINE